MTSPQSLSLSVYIIRKPPQLRLLGDYFTPVYPIHHCFQQLSLWYIGLLATKSLGMLARNYFHNLPLHFLHILQVSLCSLDILHVLNFLLHRESAWHSWRSQIILQKSFNDFQSTPWKLSRRTMRKIWNPCSLLRGAYRWLLTACIRTLWPPCALNLFSGSVFPQ